MFKRGSWLWIHDQFRLFEGCVKLSTSRVKLPDKSIVGRAQFNVIFGSYTFYLDDAIEKKTKSAWVAFTARRWPWEVEADISRIKSILVDIGEVHFDAALTEITKRRDELLKKNCAHDWKLSPIAGDGYTCFKCRSWKPD